LFEKLKIFGIPFAKVTFTEAVNILQNHLRKNEPLHIITANPEVVMYALQDNNYSQILKEAQMIVPDGIGVVLLSKKWGVNKLPERIAGYDLLHALLKFADLEKRRVFLFGAKEEVNNLAYQKIQKLYPEAVLAGRRNGYFSQEEEELIVEQIAQAKPDILFVALGVPRQEEFIYKYKDKLNSTIMIGVGGSFDVLAGTVKRAPVTWQKIGLEWLFRLLQEPKRWRRMLSLPRFLIKGIITSKKKHENW